MKITNLIDKDLETELKYVDIDNNKKHKKEDKIISTLKEKIKFEPKNIDTSLYYNQITMIFVYFLICLVSVFFGDFLSIINPIIMGILLILISSNPLSIDKNNRYLDFGISNLVTSLNMIIKSLGLNEISKKYLELTEFFSKIFIFSLLLVGHQGFNLTLIIASIGLTLSFILSLANKDIEIIKSVGENIQNKELKYVLISTLIFAIAFKGSVANTTAFTIIILFKYFFNIIKDYEFQDI